MLEGIDPLLTGALLCHLDEMGHSDTVVVADANFPAHRLGARVVELAAGAPEATRAIRSVLPLDAPHAAWLMAPPNGAELAVQSELVDAAAVPQDGVSLLERQAFYDAAAAAFLVVRTGEARPYGNVILAKGVIAREGVR